MSGSGNLTKSGTGTVTLSGANSYSGGTTVSAGTLVGTTASLQGAITNNAITTFNQSSSGTYSGAMSGSGSLIKTGSGTVTLSGANTYSGGTTVSGGSLMGTTTSLQGNFIDNANLNFNQDFDGTYGGIISGTGTLTKSGEGKLILSVPTRSAAVPPFRPESCRAIPIPSKATSPTTVAWSSIRPQAARSPDI